MMLKETETAVNVVVKWDNSWIRENPLSEC